MDYLLWNDRIAAHFFNPEMRGRRVHLHITQELIRDIGKSEAVGISDFIRSVKLGAPWCTGQPVCLGATETMAGWRRRKRQFPPYIPVLSLFVLAAAVGDEGEFAAQAYYPRLRKLLGEEQDGKPYPHFSEMRSLWRDLEVWTQRDMSGAIGVFEFPATGRLVHVGVPISQVILTADERRSLPLIFVEAALDPGASPSDSYLAGILAEFGAQLLRSRTIRILENPSNFKEEYQALIEAVLEELQGWDGKVTQVIAGGAKRTSIHGSLRLCCEEIDLVANLVTLRLRCRVRQEFPEDDLLLSAASESVQYKCQEYAGGWSTMLEESETRRPLDASKINIFADLAMRESGPHGWRFKLPKTDVRVLISGATEGLPGYIEVQQLPSDSSFYLVASPPAWNLIERWGQSSCQGFKHLHQLRGLPADCRCYSVSQALNDNIVRSVYPTLSFPSSERIRLEGGIRLSGNTFFGFALPRIVVEASKPNFQVFCNGEELAKSRDGDFVLPSRIPDGTTLEIEVRNGDKPLVAKSIFVYSRFPWQNLPTLAWFDTFGLTTQHTEIPRVAGAHVEANGLPSFEDWIRATPQDVEEPIWERPEPPPKTADHVAELNASTALSIDELTRLLHEWRDELQTAQVFTTSTSQLASRAGGDQLTEGAIHYRAGVANNDPKSFNRAIRIFADLIEHSKDTVVQILARTLQQLAFYRSGRTTKASSVDLSSFPAEFSRLESAMRALADLCGAANDVSTWPDGLCFSDFSPMQEDRLLEDQIRLSILSKCVTV